MAHTTSLHLLVILLGFTHLIFLNAVPIGRTRNLMHETESTQDLLASSDNIHKAMTEEILEKESINGRMDLEMSNDYPGSGANNRHTPKPPLGSRS